MCGMPHKGMTKKPSDKRLVRTKFDTLNPPPLTKAQRAQLKALAAMPDSEIDTSDIPPLPDSFWENGVRGKYYRGGPTAAPLKAPAAKRR